MQPCRPWHTPYWGHPQLLQHSVKRSYLWTNTLSRGCPEMVGEVGQDIGLIIAGSGAVTAWHAGKARCRVYPAGCRPSMQQTFARPPRIFSKWQALGQAVFQRPLLSTQKDPPTDSSKIHTKRLLPPPGALGEGRLLCGRLAYYEWLT